MTDGLEVALDRSMTAALARWFPTTDLAHIGDEIADGLFEMGGDFPCRTSMACGQTSRWRG